VLLTSVMVWPSFPMARFSRWLLSNCSRCSLLKAARAERFPDKVRAGPGVPPLSSFFSEDCALDVSCFVSEGANPSTKFTHPLLIAQSKTRLFPCRSPALRSSWRSCRMSSPYSDVAAVFTSVLYSIVACRALPSSLLYRRSFMTASLTPCRNGMAGRPSAGGDQLLLGPFIALSLFLRLSAVPYG
jgi:hypothetical protein